MERLFSPYWYRVAELRPRLGGHVRLHRHVYRGQRWYVLENPAAQQHHRFAPAAYYVISLMDGRRSVEEIWDAALDQLGDEAPTQGEMITLLAQIHAAGALRCDVPPDTGQLFARQIHDRARRAWAVDVRNPLFMRFPLWDPDAWLGRWHERVGLAFTGTAWWLWFALVGFAAVTALRYREALAAQAAETLWNPRALLLLVVLYPFVKGLHELGHAMAARHWGAPVHEIGVMLLVGMPVPYVDASATAVFPSKHARMVVGAAGVMVELALASIALFVWVAVAPGIIELAAFQVMVIGGVSTLFFNGNPLVRFDGYYVLSDLLEIPNLSTRANEYLRMLVETRLLGLPERRPSDVSPGERPWLVAYAVLAFVYRIFLTLAISLLVASRFFGVGVALAIWSLILQLVVPAVQGVASLVADPRVAERRSWVWLRASAALAFAALALFVLPFPMWTVSEGVVWLPESAQVRAGGSGVVTRILARPGSRVPEGAPLLEIRDAVLDAEVRVLEARVREARARYEAKRSVGRVAVEIAREELAAVAAELARARDRQGAGVVRALAAGRLVLPHAEDLPGRYFEKGAVIGYLEVEGSTSLRVVVPQKDVARVRSDTREVTVRFPGGEPIAATLEREVPQATDRLPSLALGAAGGGEVAIDGREPGGLTALESLFQFDVRVADGVPVPGLGAVAGVRFDHGDEPVGWRAIRAVRRLLLGSVHV